MKWILSLVGVLGCLILAPSVGGSARPQLPVAIHGEILNAATGQPVEHASVYVAAASLGARSGSLGRFLIRGVHDEPPIQVTIEHPCFHSVRVELETSYYAPLRVGLPFREPEGQAGEAVPGACSIYRPN